MATVSKYWQLVRLSNTGKRRVELIEEARTFFEQNFPNLSDQSNIADGSIQQALLLMMNDAKAAASVNRVPPAELCLKCCISHQIEKVCIHLEAQFGLQHGFSREDLFPLVLDEEGLTRQPRQAAKGYRSIADQVLQSFEPGRGTLNTWVIRQVKHHPEVKAFLREQGVYLATDWGLLNDLNPQQLPRILSDFYTLSTREVELATALLHSYHLIYRQDRLRQKQQGLLSSKAVCLPPTLEQLLRIATDLQSRCNVLFSADNILQRLQSLAQQLRQYRLSSSGGKLPTESLDLIPDQAFSTPLLLSDNSEENDQREFLRYYRSAFSRCLDQALAQCVVERCQYLQKKSSQKKSSQTAKLFVQALHLFHCQGQSMGDIAPQVGLNAQFQVTRLLKLKEFRANIQGRLLQLLMTEVLEQARLYRDSPSADLSVREFLPAFKQQIETALAEQIEQTIQQAESEAAVAKHRPLDSLLARRLCHYLDSQSGLDCPA
jgi:hypothetical protein